MVSVSQPRLGGGGQRGPGRGRRFSQPQTAVLRLGSGLKPGICLQCQVDRASGTSGQSALHVCSHGGFQASGHRGASCRSREDRGHRGVLWTTQTVLGPGALGRALLVTSLCWAAWEAASPPFAFSGDEEIRAEALGKDKVNMLLITRAPRQMRRVRPGSPRLRLQHQFPAAGRLPEPRTFPGIWHCGPGAWEWGARGWSLSPQLVSFPLLISTHPRGPCARFCFPATQPSRQACPCPASCTVSRVLRLGPPAPTSSICPIHATAARRADENQKPPGPASPLGHRGDSVTICFQWSVDFGAYYGNRNRKTIGGPSCKKHLHPPKGALSNFRVASTSPLMKRNSDRDPGGAAPDGRGRSGMFSLTRQSGVGRAFARHTEQTRSQGWATWHQALSSPGFSPTQECGLAGPALLGRWAEWPDLHSIQGKFYGEGRCHLPPGALARGLACPWGCQFPGEEGQRGALAGPCRTNLPSFLQPTCSMSGISPDEPAIERTRTVPARARRPGSIHGGRSEAERRKAVMDGSGQHLLSFLECEKSQLGPFQRAAWSHILPEMLHACVHVWMRVSNPAIPPGFKMPGIPCIQTFPLLPKIPLSQRELHFNCTLSFISNWHLRGN